MTAGPTPDPDGPYPGKGVNLAHALHDAIECAEKRDPHFKVGKDYKVLTTVIEAGNSHVHVFKVEIGQIGP